LSLCCVIFAASSLDDTATAEIYTLSLHDALPISGDAGYGITASGKPVEAGVTVACPPDLPFGTVLRIEGVGERVCHDRGGAIKRSEEHTSELQSRENLVCRLLLEKKKEANSSTKL